MALIKCPECGKEISDKASACPNCAYPFGNNNYVVNELKKQSEYTMICRKKRVFKVFLTLTIICVACLGIMLLWQLVNSRDITSARASSFISSISGGYQSSAEKRLVKIDNVIEMVKKILYLPIIIFGILSIYHYIVLKKSRKQQRQ